MTVCDLQGCLDCSFARHSERFLFQPVDTEYWSDDEGYWADITSRVCCVTGGIEWQDFYNSAVYEHVLISNSDDTSQIQQWSIISSPFTPTTEMGGFRRCVLPGSDRRPSDRSPPNTAGRDGSRCLSAGLDVRGLQGHCVAYGSRSHTEEITSCFCEGRRTAWGDCEAWLM